MTQKPHCLAGFEAIDKLERNTPGSVQLFPECFDKLGRYWVLSPSVVPSIQIAPIRPEEEVILLVTKCPIIYSDLRLATSCNTSSFKR